MSDDDRPVDSVTKSHEQERREHDRPGLVMTRRFMPTHLEVQERMRLVLQASNIIEQEFEAAAPAIRDRIIARLAETGVVAHPYRGTHIHTSDGRTQEWFGYLVEVVDPQVREVIPKRHKPV